MLPLLVPVVQIAPPLDPSASGAAWPATSAVTLQWNVAHATTATEPTTVHVATNGTYFYVRFDAVQHEPIIASQHSDDVITGGSNINGAVEAGRTDLWCAQLHVGHTRAV